jgi:hypothetical protein
VSHLSYVYHLAKISTRLRLASVLYLTVLQRPTLAPAFQVPPISPPSASRTVPRPWNLLLTVYAHYSYIIRGSGQVVFELSTYFRWCIDSFVVEWLIYLSSSRNIRIVVVTRACTVWLLQNNAMHIYCRN